MRAALMTTALCLTTFLPTIGCGPDCEGYVCSASSQTSVGVRGLVFNPVTATADGVDFECAEVGPESSYRWFCHIPATEEGVIDVTVTDGTHTQTVALEVMLGPTDCCGDRLQGFAEVDFGVGI